MFKQKKQVSDPFLQKMFSPIAIHQPPGILKVNDYIIKFNLIANILNGKSILPNTDFFPLPGI